MTPVDDRHLVSITRVYTPEILNVATTGRASKNVKKKEVHIPGRIKLEGITRVELIKAFLTIANLQNQYAPGVHSGPEFKLSWNGSK